jgi:hypothetical protein
MPVESHRGLQDRPKRLRDTHLTTGEIQKLTEHGFDYAAFSPEQARDLLNTFDRSKRPRKQP